MPDFTTPVHEHGTPGEPNYPHGKGGTKALGKTAQAMLTRAQSHPHGTISVTFGYVGRKRFGNRELKAVRELVRAGKVRFVQSSGMTPEFRRRNFGRDVRTGRARIHNTQVGQSSVHVFELVK